MTCGYTLVVAVIQLVTNGFAWWAVSKVALVNIFCGVATLVLDLAREATSWGFGVSLSAAWDSDGCLLTAAGYFGFSWARVTGSAVADRGALVPSTLKRLVTHFLTWWTVAIAAFLSTSMFATVSASSAFCVTSEIFATGQ